MNSTKGIISAVLLFSFAATIATTTHVFATKDTDYKAGYQRELSDWTMIVVNGTNGELHCPLGPHSAYCNGYNDAMHLEAGHQ